MSSSTAARKLLTKYLPRKLSYNLQEIPVVLYTQMPYDLLIVYKVQKYFASRDCLVLRLKFIACAAQPFSEIYDAGVL
jgi:hypothetical protein